MIRDLYIKASAPASASRSTAKLMKTGQTTSYRTGDDGDLEAGRATSFLVLAENNPFGNTNRFTDELGGSTYTNDIVIDWSTFDGSTVLGYRRTMSASAVTWNTAIDECLSLSISVFTSGWRLPNRCELFSLWNSGTIKPINYSPFNLSSAVNAWSSTTNANSATQAIYFVINENAQVIFAPKTNTISYFPVRTFTVTGTTLS